MMREIEARAPSLRMGGNERRIIRSLGGGSMGEVYLVENLDHRRLEAFKIMRGQETQHAPLAARFRREGRALERLHHRNVVSVYDHGELPGFGLYLAMEYVDGPDLEYALAAGVRFSLPRCVGLLEQLASAVDHTHECGVIHRDLKPGNLILARHGADNLIKVMDFGISKIFAVDYEGTTATRHGVCLGTPAYMAPEQFGDVLDDPRIDIYALGCIAYELVTGATPFRGTLAQLFRAHVEQAPVRPSEAAPDAAIPTLLDDIIMQCLAKRPGDRFQRGRDVVDALAAIRAPRRRAGTATADDADTRIERSRFATHDGPTLHDTLAEIAAPEIAPDAGKACAAEAVSPAAAVQRPEIARRKRSRSSGTKHAYGRRHVDSSNTGSSTASDVGRRGAGSRGM